MNDPLRRTLQQLDRPIAPDRAFADELFARLLEEAAPGPVRRAPMRRRAPDGVRRALVATIALGLAAAVFVVTLPLLRTDAPKVGDFGEMPPFRGVVEFVVSPELLEGVGNTDPPLTPGRHRIEVVYAGPDAWRFRLLDDGLPSILPPVAGSIGAWDGERFRYYDAGVNGFGTQDIGAPAFTILNPLAWSAPGWGWEENCLGRDTTGDLDVVGSDVLLGREAIAVRCVPASSRLWLDAQTGLVLRAEVAANATSRAFHGPIGPGPGGGFRFVELAFGGVTPADAAFDPPPDAVPFRDLPAPPPTALTIGEPVPSLPRLEGQGLELTPPNGRPTVLYVWAIWCGRACTGEPLDVFDRESRALASQLNAFAISSYDQPEDAEGFFDARDLDVPLVHDTFGQLTSWGNEVVPTLIVLDGDGRLLGAYAGDLDGEEMRDVLRAVAAGDPLPELGGDTTGQIA